MLDEFGDGCIGKMKEGEGLLFENLVHPDKITKDKVTS